MCLFVCVCSFVCLFGWWIGCLCLRALVLFVCPYVCVCVRLPMCFFGGLVVRLLDCLID